MIPISLVGTASYLPERVVGNDFFPGGGESGSPMFKGSRLRHHVGPDESATEMIVRATRRLAERCDLDPRVDIDLVLTNVSLPDLPFTGCGAAVVRRLGCQPRFVVDLHNTGCISFVFMLKLAQSLMESTGARSALLCNVQTAAGRVFADPGNLHRPQAAIPGDGCGVAYVVAGTESPVKAIAVRTCPDFADDMQIRCDSGGDYWAPRPGPMYIDFDESRVATIVARGNRLVPDVIREACRGAELAIGDIDVLVTNQPNPVFLRNWRESLQLPEAAHVHTFAEHGNLFGAGIPISLERAADDGKLRPGSHVVIGGFSHAGDYAAAAVVHWRPGGRSMILADGLATALRDWGVDYVFGVSGANIEHLHDAIHRLGEGRLRSVLARSEAGAAFMADARARVHRTLGVCCATSGGGMMNLAVGVAESFAESVPVLALVGQVPTSHEGRGGFQDSSGVGRTVDAVGLWRSIAKFVARVTAPADFWSLLHQAALVALSGRPGPAVLLLPRDLQAAEVPPMPAWFPRELAAMRRPSPIRDQTAVRALLERLRQARRPVLVMGSGVARCSNPGAVARFARECGVPVVTTIADPGAFGNDEPRYLGTIGVAGHPSAHRYLNEDADLIVAVGTGLDVMTRAPIAPALARVPVGVINVDVGPILRVVDPAFVIEADAGAVFEDWLAAVRQRPYTAPLTDAVPATRFRPRLAAPIDPVAAELVPRLRQSEAIEQLQRYLPTAGHVIFDAGNCAATALHFLAIPAGVTSTIALGMGGMGYALAAGTGAQLGSAPGTRTMVLCGDGAFLMLGLEIHCAIELGLPVLFVVFNNQKHGMCVTRQQLYFGGRISASTYAGVDVAAVARGLGGSDALWTGRASTGGELAACLAAYHAEPVSRPGVLELVLPAEEVPPFTPFLPVDAETYVVARGPQRVTAATAA